MTLAKIIQKAQREGRIRKNLVICDHCGNPADKEYSIAAGYPGCAPCLTDGTDSLDPAHYIPIEQPSRRKKV
jgi:formylmethanofuran dehydrogenase subunit E